MERCSCSQRSYSFKPLHRIVRSLQTAVKSAVRIDTSGMLGVQFMLPELKGKFAYVDFVVSTTIKYVMDAPTHVVVHRLHPQV
jgi:glyceraldehyde-3-phosphate dehydrogenase/erythrose-4-phosphate dehydrogenase